MRLVLLPGLDGTGKLFKPLIEELPPNIEITIIRYSTTEKQNYHALINFVIAQLPEEDFVLVGESFSGYIAYQIALKHLKHLKEVIFVASFLSNPRPLALGITQYFPRNLLFSYSPPTLIIKQFMLGFDTKKTIIQLFLKTLKEVTTGLILFRLDEITKLRRPTEQSKVKAVYIQAQDDYLVPAQAIADFENCFSHLSIIKVTGPHFLLQAKPVECVEIIVASL